MSLNVVRTETFTDRELEFMQSNSPGNSNVQRAAHPGSAASQAVATRQGRVHRPSPRSLTSSPGRCRKDAGSSTGSYGQAARAEE